MVTEIVPVNLTHAQARLDALYRESPRRAVSADEKIVVMSDFHMGNGGRNDDFRTNGPVVLSVLRDYYLEKNYTLILNGDIEEWLRHPRAAILEAWHELYTVLDEFRRRDRLVWLRGNHEILPRAELPESREIFDGESLILETPQGPVFIFHGHQAGVANSGKFNGLIGWSLRTFANALGIGNRSVAHSSSKKFKLEKAIYQFSLRHRLVSIIGHTHRPLFESLSKHEVLGGKIERLCRHYGDASDMKRIVLRALVQSLKAEYLSPEKRRDHHLSSSIYGEILVPCVFNAGCAVGKRGFTALEIKKGQIGLVAWSRHKPPQEKARMVHQAWRRILRREPLSYVFSRVELLS